MSDTILKILMLVWIHWLADFVCQTDYMAKGKSKSIKILSYHVWIYSVMFLPFGWKMFAVNFVTHWIIDYFSSRATSKLWAKGDVHNFFVVIGLDQALHLTTLILAAVYL